MPTGARDDSDWLVIDDFRPGIHHLVSPNTPRGAATDETYRCRASVTGALVPAPRRIAPGIVLQPSLDPSDNGAEEFRLCGLVVNDPVFTAGDNTFGVDQNNSEIYVGIEQYNTPNGNYDRSIYRYLAHRETPVWDHVATDSPGGVTFDPYTRPKRCYFAIGRSNEPDPTQVGPAVVGWAFGGWGAYFPDENDTSGTGIVPFPGTSNPLVAVDTLIGHQGRALLFPLSLSQLGTVDGQPVVYATNECFYWSEVNDWRTLDDSLDGFFNVLAGYENPTGYSVVASLAADELFLIKARGGGLVIRGSLNDFTAITLPNLRPAGQSLDLGTTSPLGYMYPVDNSGVWLWAGGETSENLTPHLRPNFFRPPPRDKNGDEVAWGNYHTQSCQFGDLVMFGANWFYDTTTTGWWHIDNPVTDDEERGYVIHKWAADWKGRLCWGTASGFRNEGDIALYRFDSTQGATSYLWTSHPLANQISRQNTPKELVVVGSGRGQVKVTIFTDRARQTLQFDFDDPDRVSAKRANVGVEGDFPQIRVYSRGLDITSDDAPSVHQLRVRMQAGTQIAQGVA
jgi:hypothetical protein